MTSRLAQIWRYPIKGVGREPLETVTLKANAPMPGDRAWALRHDAAPRGTGWQPRRDFLVVANGPKLAQVTARTEADGSILLHHPERPPLCAAPETDPDALLDWVRPLWPGNAPDQVVRSPAQGMGDNGKAELSLLSLASLKELSGALGQDIEIERFRGNLVLDGAAPWEEFNWIGKTLRIGAATLQITARIERCRATEASPRTGTRDAEPVRALHTVFGHRDFGVYARVISAGKIEIGNEVETL
ncbi:MOSC domain-containing protein [Citreicella sp. C3M06]|uniref:MOSC domain-containing protein n=1 Tax=Citreicella sp. C3M06 TaxID=2841564 RepID=UPI001C092E87|nr:MOSC domain-containing protein [Citreicella sp. C3M06]MBU2961857.1 MOSC domain-containing protein [Citreicella sp. C3M06]